MRWPTWTGRAVVQNGGDSWFFITADYAFGQSLEKDASAVVRSEGGKVLGDVRHPINVSDFSSFLLTAQASGAKIIALANAGGDTINAIKTAREFGIGKDGKQSLAGLLVYINDVHSLGLAQTQGMYLTEGFYWDRDDASRAWSKRYFDKTRKMPNMSQAGAYSATMHYLNAVKAAGTDATDAVMAKMREMPINDMYAKNGRIRADGRMVHDMYLFQVKKPEESKAPWDYYNVKSSRAGRPGVSAAVGEHLFACERGGEEVGLQGRRLAAASPRPLCRSPLLPAHGLCRPAPSR